MSVTPGGIFVEYEPDPSVESVQVLDEEEQRLKNSSDHQKRRSRAHSASRVTVARYKDHYTKRHSIDSPSDTFKPWLRYGRESDAATAKIDESDTIEAMDRPKVVLYEKAIQCKATVKTQANWIRPNTHDFSVQVNRGKTRTKNATVHCQLDNEYKTKPEVQAVGPDILEDIFTKLLEVREVIDNQATSGETQNLTLSVEKVTKTLLEVQERYDALDVNGKELLGIVKTSKPIPCQGPHISEDVLNGIANFMKIIDQSERDLQSNIGHMKTDLIGQKEQSESRHATMEARLQALEHSLSDIKTLLRERLKKKDNPQPAKAPKFTRPILVHECRCRELRTQMSDKFLFSYCQFCTYRAKAEDVFKTLNISPPNKAVVDVVGVTLQKIVCESETGGIAEKGLDNLRNILSSMRQNDIHEFYEWLLSYSINNEKPDWSKAIAEERKMDLVHLSKRKTKEYKIGDETRDSDWQQNLMQREGARSWKYVLESIKIHPETTTKMKKKKSANKDNPLYMSADNGDAGEFNYLLESMTNASHLEMADPQYGGNIFHHLVYLSYETKLLSKNEAMTWDKSIRSMLESLYKHCWKWIAWKYNNSLNKLNETTIESTEKQDYDRTIAIDMLVFSVVDKNGWNAFCAAGLYGTPTVIKVMLSQHPVLYIPEEKYINYESCYIVERIDPASLGDAYGETKPPSLLELIIRRDQKDATEILQIEPLKSLIDTKWKRHWGMLVLWFIIYIAYMAIYTCCAFQRPVNARSIPHMYQTTTDWLRLAGEIISITGLLFFMIGELTLLKSLYNKSFLEALKWYLPRPWRRTGFHRILTIWFVIFSIMVVVYRLRLSSDEDIYLALSLIIGWMNATDFFIAFDPTASFPSIMHKIFIEDLLKRWIPVFLLALVATSTATHIAFQSSSIEQFPNSSYLVSTLSLFKLTYGLLETDYVTEAREPTISIILFVVYIWLGTTLLLNLLIAMMSNTYSKEDEKLAQARLAVKASYAIYMEKMTWRHFSVRFHHDYKTLFMKDDAKIGYIQVKKLITKMGGPDWGWFDAVLMRKEPRDIVRKQTEIKEITEETGDKDEVFNDRIPTLRELPHLENAADIDRS